MRIFVGQPEDADAAADAARLERQILEPDIGDRDLAFDQRRVDPQRARSRVGQPGIETAEAAGRQRLPGQRRRAGLPSFLSRFHKLIGAMRSKALPVSVQPPSQIV